MRRNVLMPLRTTVGAPLPIRAATVVQTSSAVEDFDVTVRPRTDLSETHEDALYARALPERVISPQGDIFLPCDGTATFPPPVDLPFAPTVPFLSVFVLGSRVEHDISRTLSVELEIELAPEATGPVGGICFGGYPYLPYYVDGLGLHSSNFGLPRELRLSWAAQSGAFIDAETSVTRQQPASHSGVHVLATGPIPATRLRLRLGDLPRLIKLASPAAGGDMRLDEIWGCVIPYLFVFRYEEGVRYRPRVPAGLLAARQTPPDLGESFFPVTGSATQAHETACPDLVFRLPVAEPRVMHDSGASVFGQRRKYVFDSPAGVTSLQESFASGRLKPDHRLVLIVEQAEEHERCIAGLRVTFPGWILSAMQISGVQVRYGVEVWEVDPPEGASPLLAAAELRRHRQARLLFEDDRMAPSAAGWTLRFVQPSTARYFALVLTNAGTSATRVVLEDVELVQSASVSIGARPSYSRRLGSLHFRVIGPALAEDFASLGGTALSLTVEHVAAGQRGTVLFTATSLLDLLRLPTARLYANHRFHDYPVDVSRETLDTEGGFEEHVGHARAVGWSRSETGNLVNWNPPGGIPASTVDRNPPTDPYAPFGTVDGHNRDHGFASFSSVETRQHSEVLPVQGDADEARRLVQDLNGLLTSLGFRPVPVPDQRRLMAGSRQAWAVNGDPRSIDWHYDVWYPLFTTDPRVEGLLNVSLPPWILLPEGLQYLDQFFRDPASLSQDEASQLLATIFPLSFLNGLTVGISGGFPYFGGSASTSQLLPLVTRSLSSGTVASILKQATYQAYSYAQYRNSRFDETRYYTDYGQGQMVRVLTREAHLKGTQRVRARGAEVAWRGALTDIVTGSIPLNIQLPATAGPMYRTTDETVRVRFGAELGPDVWIDVWFEAIEEAIRDDY